MLGQRNPQRGRNCFASPEPVLNPALPTPTGTGTQPLLGVGSTEAPNPRLLRGRRRGLASPRAPGAKGAGTGRAVLGGDLREKQDPSPSSKGRSSVGFIMMIIFPFIPRSQGTNSTGPHPRRAGSAPRRAPLIAAPERRRQLRSQPGERVHPNGDLRIYSALPLRSLHVRFYRRSVVEFPLPGGCVTSGSLCRSLSKRWSRAQLFLI